MKQQINGCPDSLILVGFLVTTFALLVAPTLASAQPGAVATMQTGPGDGQVHIEVDAYGSFGYRTFGFFSGGIGDALLNPVGPNPFCRTRTGFPDLCTTTWEYGLYFRAAPPDNAWLTTGCINSGAPCGLSDPGFISATPTSATSSFPHAGLVFDLEQRLEDLVGGSGRVGSVLIQDYVITNPGPSVAAFSLVRYFEGDLITGVPDGGGHIIFPSGDEFVFETDVAGDSSTLTTLVGITACGGTIPTSGRYEVNSWPSMGNRIGQGLPLQDLVFWDGSDPDEFVDAGADYDVGVAMANDFSLGPGESARYVATTIFGTIPPELALGGCEEIIGRDDDDDGVPNDQDLCADTDVPESVPTIALGTNRFALVDDDDVFDTKSPEGRGPRRQYTLTDTAGCSCEQIIDAAGLGNGHRKYGCSISAMDDWVAAVSGQSAVKAARKRARFEWRSTMAGGARERPPAEVR